MALKTKQIINSLVNYGLEWFVDDEYRIRTNVIVKKQEREVCPLSAYVFTNHDILVDVDEVEEFCTRYLEYDESDAEEFIHGSDCSIAEMKNELNNLDTTDDEGSQRECLIKRSKKVRRRLEETLGL